MGGLSHDTNEDKLKAYFSRFGNVVDCIVMRDPLTSQPRGFGFLTFEEPAAVDKVMTTRPHMIDDRDVEPKRAIPREKQTGRTGGMAGQIKKVFVGGIKDSIDEDELRSHFSYYGTVESIELVRDRETQRKRGFAFVGFTDCDTVDKVCGK